MRMYADLVVKNYWTKHTILDNINLDKIMRFLL